MFTELQLPFFFLLVCLLLCLTLQALWLSVMPLSLICILRVSLRVVMDCRQLLRFYIFRIGKKPPVASEQRSKQQLKNQVNCFWNQNILRIKLSLVSIMYIMHEYPPQLSFSVHHHP